MATMLSFWGHGRRAVPGSAVRGRIPAGSGEWRWRTEGYATAVAYTWGADGLVSERFLPSGPSRWYHFGPQGETRYLTDATSATADTYLYTAYGVPVASTGGDRNPFRYGGQFGYYTDPGGPSGIILCGARWYDPYTARWMTRDPIGYDGGENLYAYCDQEPIGWTDPLGTDGWGVFDGVADGIALIPGAGEFVDAGHAVTYLIRWDLRNAALYGLSAVPVAHEIGSIIKGVRWGCKAAQHGLRAWRVSRKMRRVGRVERIAAAKVERVIVRGGDAVVAREVTVRLAEGTRRRIDKIVRRPDGSLYAVEPKAKKARRSARQARADKEIEQIGAELRGKNADPVRELLRGSSHLQCETPVMRP